MDELIDYLYEFNVRSDIGTKVIMPYCKTYCNSYNERRIINELKRFLYSLQRRR
jgi:hypothetical protein